MHGGCLCWFQAWLQVHKIPLLLRSCFSPGQVHFVCIGTPITFTAQFLTTESYEHLSHEALKAFGAEQTLASARQTHLISLWQLELCWQRDAVLIDSCWFVTP